MGNIITFPVKKTIYTCGQCSIFKKCYNKSLEIYGLDTEKEKEESKKIPACDKINLQKEE